MELKDILLSESTKLSELDINHPAITYVKNRLVEDRYLNDIYWVENFENWIKDKKDFISVFSKNLEYDPNFSPGNLNEKFSNFNFQSDHNFSLLLFPCRNLDKELICIHARKIEKIEKLERFILFCKKNTRQYYYYGLERLNFKEKIFISEGQFDSLSIDNCLSLCGVVRAKYLLEEDWFSKLDKKNIFFVLDHDPTDWLIYSWSIFLTQKGYKVCILPFWLKSCDANSLLITIKNKWLLKKIILIFSLLPSFIQNKYLKLRWRVLHKLRKIFSKHMDV